MKTRTAAASILISLPPGGYNYESATDRFIQANSFSQPDRDFIYLLVKGVIQYQRLLDFIIDQARKKKRSHIENIARALLRIGVFQIVILNIPAHAAVHETVAVARQINRHDLTDYINAVLRHLPEEGAWRENLRQLDPAVALAIEYSHPEWLVKKWLANFGRESTVALLGFDNDYQEIYFRHNPLRGTWAEFEKLLQERAFQVEPYATEPICFFKVDRPGDLLKSDFFREGRCSVQDFSQSLAVRLLDPLAGETILDACAAPGGKATYIAQITQNRAHVQANDRTPHKIELVKESACRLGIDSLYYSMSDASIAKFPTVDKALVDAPCTGTGILARRADLRWNRRPEELIRARAIQAGILNNVAAAVRDQGFLVYSTCSLEYEENWTTVTEFIDCHPEFSVEPADKYVDSCYCDEKGAVRILPFIHNLTGSFAVRLKKIS
ncbi:MAG: 16S rRNA (cytosine(967)-C(5))-methyltransferase RsmB [Candidatus Neomarinimicrobiota bacterium]